MTISIRERRIEQEGTLLVRLGAANPGLLEIGARWSEPDAEIFGITLSNTPGLVRGASGLTAVNRHSAAIYFRLLYPAVPIEVSLARPVVHPNVHPDSGFVCLWGRFSPSDTVIEAIAQLHRVITWQRWNDGAVHVMQRDAHALVRDGWKNALPLTTVRLAMPPEVQRVRTLGVQPARYRPRLS